LSNEDGSVWVTFNGEIYNHADLRKQLVAAGHRFQTDHSDTEVIVHAYEEWGIDGLVKAIEGDFAIGLWDDRNKELFLIRDRIGVKPLYYTDIGGVIHFASEIKAILKHPQVPRALDRRAMRHYLAFLTTPAPWTMFEGIYKLPAGYYLHVSQEAGIRVTCYWDALPGQSGFDLNPRASFDDPDLIAEVRSRLAASVAKRVMSDVPIGVMLSGGIDSTTNVALMSAIMSQPVNTFTVGFRDYPALNETDEARKIASIYGTSHHEVLIERQDMEGYIDSLVHTQDEPIADWVCIPLHFVSQLVRDSGVRVVQVGEGADEQFIGYQHYLNYYRLRRYFWKYYLHAPSIVRKSLASVMGAVADRIPKFHRHAEFLERAALRGELFWSGSVVYWDRFKRMLLGEGDGTPQGCLVDSNYYGGTDVRETADLIREMYRPYDESGRGDGVLQRMIYSEFKLRLPELLLMRVDKISMASSIEARVPFLDHHMVNLTMELPDSVRLGKANLKSVLKQAVRNDVPPATLARKKRGFDAPMAEWLREGFGMDVEGQILNSPLVRSGTLNGPFIRSLFREHRSGIDRAIFIWVIFNLTQWHNYWIER
jgi:asparagine synthase (glutamine-hydrolysing)